MAKMTKRYAKEILDIWKNESALFNGSVTTGQLESILECDAKIKQADRIAIIMALILAGAKFSDCPPAASASSKSSNSTK